MYRCPKGCFSSDPNFRCIHGGATGKSIEPVLGAFAPGDVVLEVTDEFDLKLQADQEDALRMQARFDTAERRGNARIREFDENARRQAERFALQDRERQRAADQWAKAMRAPLSGGCPIPRRLF